jgi:hypothetical protein
MRLDMRAVGDALRIADGLEAGDIGSTLSRSMTTAGVP